MDNMHWFILTICVYGFIGAYIQQSKYNVIYTQSSIKIIE